MNSRRTATRLLGALVAAVLVVIVLALAARHDRLALRLRAVRILRASRAAYAACATYEDDGRMETTFRGKSGHSQVTKFRTAFAGPDHLRFAYLDLSTEYFPARLTELIADETGVRTATSWQGNVRRKQESSLTAAAGALAGVSHGLTAAILPMLPSGIDGGGASLDMTDAVDVGTEDVDREPCDVIEGIRRSTHVRIWIARHGSLIRRVTEDTTLSEDQLRAEVDAPNVTAGGLSTFVDTTFHPRCGGAIDPRDLRESDSL